MRKRIIAFDFDGTIADSMNLEHRSMLYAIHLAGHNEITDDNLEDHFGPTESGIIRKVCGEEAFHKVYPSFLAKYKEIEPEEMKPIPGMKELLEDLSKESSVALVLVTGRSKDTMEISLDYLGVRPYFKKTYWGSEEGINKDQNLEKAASDFKVSKEEILYIGDTLADIETMEKAGIDLLSVGYCHNEKDQAVLKENNPNGYIGSVQELRDRLFSIIKEKEDDSNSSSPSDNGSENEGGSDTAEKADATAVDVNDPVSSEELHQALITLDKGTLLTLFEETSAVQLSDALRELDNDEIVLFYSANQTDFDKLGEIFSYLSVDEREALVNNLNKKVLVPVLANVSNDDLADFLEDIPKSEREKILALLPNKRKNIVVNLASYSDDAVGSIMTTEYLSVLPGTTIKEVLKKIKQIGKRLETVRTIFVVDSTNKLLGVERLEDLMFEDENKRIEEVMAKDFAYIDPKADKESAIPICQEYDLPVLPVVSSKGELLGILTFDDVMDVFEQENTEDVLKQAAVAPTDTPYMESKVYKIAFSYVIWLIVLLVINTFTGIIISRFENALLTLPILVAFIPSLNDSIGNSSSQTASMVIRAITTENVGKKDYFKIILKELLVGFLTGLVVAVFNFGWCEVELNTPILDTSALTNNTDLVNHFGGVQNVYLVICMITSISLLIGITCSKLCAAVLPMIAKAIHIDPAVMSGPLMSSLMDILTILIYFSIATMMIDGIVPGTLTVLAPLMI